MTADENVMIQATGDVEIPLPSYEEATTFASYEEAFDSNPPNDPLRKRNEDQRSEEHCDKSSSAPQPEHCIIHLKLLFAFYKLREHVMSTPGLFGIDDSWLPSEGPECTEATLKAREALADKRWNIYVNRAVLRFEAWWEYLKIKIDAKRGTMDLYFKSLDQVDLHPIAISKSQLPPLDVLMIWHSFLLSPRRYFEDCLLQGMTRLWGTSFPWNAIDESIDEQTGEYNTGFTPDSSFVGTHTWSNTRDDCTKVIVCPACPIDKKRRWSGTNKHHNPPGGKNSPYWINVSCTNFPERLEALKTGFLVADAAGSFTIRKTLGWKNIFEAVREGIDYSEGWADSGFLCVCPRCEMKIKNDTLCAAKYVSHAMEFFDPSNHSSIFEFNRVRHLPPMPGTLLDARTGILIPKSWLNDDEMVKDDSVYPVLHTDALANMEKGKKRLPGYMPYWAFSIGSLRSQIGASLNIPGYIECATREMHSTVKKNRRIQLRRMMSYYNGNPSQFTFDLASAVHRQSSFIQKMQQIDWLHSPALTSTAKRIVEKYNRFLIIISQEPKDMAVPTLDVDLAWHTNQLDPYNYYNYSIAKTGRFVDHDDKVSETKLSTCFSRTSKHYQRLFNEPYSMCTCWYCEAIHASNSSIRESFHFSSWKTGYVRPESAPDDGTAAHISTHNAVRVVDAGPEHRKEVKQHLKWLEKAYQRACERAKKEGRPPPVRKHPSTEKVEAYTHRDSVNGKGLKDKESTIAGAAGVGIFGAGVTVVAITADGELQFEEKPQEVNTGSGGSGGASGCAHGTCGGGVGWGGGETDGVSSAGDSAGDSGGSGGCGGCGGCGG